MDYKEFKLYDPSELIDEDTYEDIVLEFIKKEWLGDGCNYKDFWPIEAVVDYICQDYDNAISFLDKASAIDDGFWDELKDYIWNNYYDELPKEVEYDEDDYLSDLADSDNDWKAEHED